jgi:hypothetical protein
MRQDEETHQRGFSRKRFAMASCFFCPPPSFNFLLKLFPRSLGVIFAVLGIPFGYGLQYVSEHQASDLQGQC